MSDKYPRSLVTRNIYVRITENGKRKYVNVGFMRRNGTIVIYKGMPLPGWFDV
jgi:hypothetical protein